MPACSAILSSNLRSYSLVKLTSRNPVPILKHFVNFVSIMSFVTLETSSRSAVDYYSVRCCTSLERRRAPCRMKDFFKQAKENCQWHRIFRFKRRYCGCVCGMIASRY